MIEANRRKCNQKNKEKQRQHAQLNTIKQIYKKFPTTLFENNARKFKLKLCMTVINSVNIVCLK